MTTDLDNPATHPSRSPRDEHPSPDELLAYHEGALSAELNDRVQEHLVACEQCSLVILDFAAFPRIEPREERDRISPADLEGQWRGLSHALERRRPLWQRHQVLLPLAAVFFAAAVGLGLWSADLRHRIEVLERPTGTVVLARELRPDGSRTRGGDQTIELPPWARSAIVPLFAPSAEAFSSYGVDLLAPAAGRTEVPVYRDADGGFSVTLPRSSLGEGEGRIELFGFREGRRIPIASYHFTVELQEP